MCSVVGIKIPYILVNWASKSGKYPPVRCWALCHLENSPLSLLIEEFSSPHLGALHFLFTWYNKKSKNSKGNVFLQVASYDFDLSLMINGIRWPIADPSPFPTPSSSSTSSSLSTGSRKCAVKSFCPYSVTMATQQSQRIQATGEVIIVELCVCLLVSDIFYR